MIYRKKSAGLAADAVWKTGKDKHGKTLKGYFRKNQRAAEQIFSRIRRAVQGAVRRPTQGHFLDVQHRV